MREYYRTNGRHDLPWRHPETDGTFDPYKIFVSEIMLQQTQVSRVKTKYSEFLKTFPSILKLSKASLDNVLDVWSGLGYNRRAKYIHESAKIINKKYYGLMPQTIEELVKLPGVGHNTAAAVLVYAYNKPHLFIETNIRTVYIHHFFKNKTNVDDSDILEIASKTIDYQQPREFYWALMDYGTYLKKKHGNNTLQSKHYIKQSAFEGSRRQLRAKVLKRLIGDNLSLNELKGDMNDKRLQAVLDNLVKEKMVHKENNHYHIA